MLTRLSHGHIRIGTFQRLAFFGEADNIDEADALLPRASLRRAAGDDDADNALRLFDLVCARDRDARRLLSSPPASSTACSTATISTSPAKASTMARGASRPTGTPDFTAAYFDHTGLYAFGRQPEAIHWDLAQLAGCLALIAEAPPLSDLLGGWPGRFEAGAGRARCCARLGVAPRGDATTARWLGALIEALRYATRRRSTASSSTGAAAAIPATKPIRPSDFDELRARCSKAAQRPLTHPYWSDAAPCSMHIDEVEAIWSAIAERDDWPPFEAKVAAIRRMGEAMDAGCTGKLDGTRRTCVERAMARTLVSTEPATGAEVWSGEIGDAAAEVAAARAAWPEWAAHSRRLPDRDAAPLRQCRPRAAKSEFAELIARETGKPFWEAQDRGRRGRQQGRDFDRRLCRADAAAAARGGARQQGRGPPQAARRAGRARPL